MRSFINYVQWRYYLWDLRRWNRKWKSQADRNEARHGSLDPLERVIFGDDK
jgi:hypothetical protein